MYPNAIAFILGFYGALAVSKPKFQRPRFNEGGWLVLSLADLLFH